MTDTTGQLAIIQEALVNAPTHCRFHQQRWDFLGRERPGGLPRCDSCKQPWRVQRALDAVDAMARAPQARPSDDVLVNGAAVTAWLYVETALKEIERRTVLAVKVAAAEIGSTFQRELRGDEPFKSLIAATDKVRSDQQDSTLPAGMDARNPGETPTGHMI